MEKDRCVAIHYMRALNPLLWLKAHVEFLGKL